MDDKYYCLKCNHELTKDEKPCPYCGSDKRSIEMELNETIDVSDKLKGSLKSEEKNENGKPIKEIKMKVEKNVEKIIHTDRSDYRTQTIQIVLVNRNLTHFHDKNGIIQIKQIDGNIYVHNDKENIFKNNIYLRIPSKDNEFEQVFMDIETGELYTFTTKGLSICR